MLRGRLDHGAGKPYIPAMVVRVINSLAPARRARGWSQAQTAAACGVSRQSYSAIEAGHAVPSAEIALRLGAAFGVPVEELFRLPDSPQKTVRAGRAWNGLAPGGRVRLAQVGGRLLAFPLGEGERVLGRADGVVSSVDGDEVEVVPLPERPPEPELVVAGCDPAFGVVTNSMRRERSVEICWMQRASLAAFEALARGEAHVAGAHLQDPLTGEFNGPWIERLIPFACTRIRFAAWEQGLLVQPGNPLAIRSVEDLVRDDMRFLNREPGSGSRALLDERLASAHVPTERVAGYDTAARGHMAVAEGIDAGVADVGIGIRAAGNAFGLHFVPLQVESYELIIPNHFLDLPAVQSLLTTLRVPGIRAQVESLGGYDAERIGLPV